MSHSNEEVSGPPPVIYQKQKVYIEELDVNGGLDTYERDLKLFLSRYGKIIDMKVLKNRKIIRAM